MECPLRSFASSCPSPAFQLVDEVKQSLRKESTRELGGVVFGDVWFHVVPKFLVVCSEQERTAFLEEAWPAYVRAALKLLATRRGVDPRIASAGEHVENESRPELSALLRKEPTLLRDVILTMSDLERAGDIGAAAASGGCEAASLMAFLKPRCEIFFSVSGTAPKVYR